MNPISYRQGDVMLFGVQGIPDGATKKEREGDIILARGEATGHAHRIKTPHAREFTLGDQRFLAVLGIASLTHEEHGTISIEPGTYEIIKQREYTPKGIRRVQD